MQLQIDVLCNHSFACTEHFRLHTANHYAQGPHKSIKANFFQGFVTVYHQTYTNIGFRCSGASLVNFIRQKNKVKIVGYRYVKIC